MSVLHNKMAISSIHWLKRFTKFIYLILFSPLVPHLYAQEQFDLRAHYEKTEQEIRMRDGIKLFTVIYSPKDHSQTYPILLIRTPYSSWPYGLDAFPAPLRIAPSEESVRAGYIFVVQEVRGTYRSGGVWENLKPVRTDPRSTDETTDTYDTIDWLVKNIPNNNGRVGQWGISHPGWYTVMGMIQPHPALKASSPQATTFDPFIGDDRHRNGAYLELTVDWIYWMSCISGPDRSKYAVAPFKGIDHGTSWNYDFFLHAGSIDKLSEHHYDGGLGLIWQDVDHPTYDKYWKSLNIGPSLASVHTPVLNVMGWFDSNDPYGAMATYHTIKKMVPENDTSIVVGPWSHGGWLATDGSKLGDIYFGSKTSEYYQNNVIFPFFEYYLKGKGHWSPNETIVFETGANRWHHLKQWPPNNVIKKTIYLGSHGQLSFEPPTGEALSYDSYISDPFHPVPYTAEIRSDRGTEFMTADQRYASTRPDVVTYQTDILNADITVAGPIPVELFCSTTGTDSDWFVKLIDVYPPEEPDGNSESRQAKMSGYEMLVGIQVMRGKFRKSFTTPKPMKPGKITTINFNIEDKYHTFKKGHRIMVQIESSWFPYIDRNPQTFVNIYKAKEENYKITTQKIYHFDRWLSHLVLPVIEEDKIDASNER